MIYIDDISNKIYIDPLFPHKWCKVHIDPFADHGYCEYAK